MKNLKQKIESWLFESSEEDKEAENIVEERVIPQPVKQETIVDEEPPKSAFLVVDEPSFVETKVFEEPKKVEPVKISRKEYQARPVISPIFGSSNNENGEKYSVDNTTYDLKSSVIGTVFSPINGKNNDKNNNLVYEREEIAKVKVDDILDKVEKPIIEEEKSLEQQVNDVINNEILANNKIEEIQPIKEIVVQPATASVSKVETLTSEEAALVAQKQQNILNQSIITNDEITVNTYSIYPEKIEKVVKKDDDKNEQISLF